MVHQAIRLDARLTPRLQVSPDRERMIVVYGRRACANWRLLLQLLYFVLPLEVRRTRPARSGMLPRAIRCWRRIRNIGSRGTEPGHTAQRYNDARQVNRSKGASPSERILTRPPTGGLDLRASRLSAHPAGRLLARSVALRSWSQGPS